MNLGFEGYFCERKGDQYILIAVLEIFIFIHPILPRKDDL